MKIVTLHKGKEQSILRQHPWVFSGAIKKFSEEPEEGEWVAVHAYQGDFLGMGHYHAASIAVRLLSFTEETVDASFWQRKVAEAYQLRSSLGLTNNSATSAYRLIYAEGDQLPGLIVDVYGATAVIQAHSYGMWLNRQSIAEAILKVSQGAISAVYDKSNETLPAGLASEAQNGYLIGDGEGKAIVQENNIRFWVDWSAGQKTGFFLDQRDNRELLGRYAAGKHVLNTFCYTGGFSLYALAAGALQVDSVDVSKKAIVLTDENVALNGWEDRHASFAEDTFSFLKNRDDQYDLIVLDPPAFAKNVRKRHNALMGYKRLNMEAMKQIKPGGILFTFSCSGVVDKNLFERTVMAAAIEAGRHVRVLHQLSQPADHPYSIFHPEGEYLKGLVLHVS